VNVWPYVGQVIGVAVKCRREHDDYGDEAYVFPVRVGVDSVYLLPEQLPMFMLPEVRRAAILLRERVKVEHALAHLSRKQGRRARYLGIRKNIFDLRRHAAVVNLEAIHRRTLAIAA
jgi:hypothetical protein